MTVEDVLRATRRRFRSGTAPAFTSLIGWADEALLPLTAGRFALTLDRTVGFAGRGLLRPIG
jgi:hypothetical protein